jgi:hypothetical protein
MEWEPMFMPEDDWVGFASEFVLVGIADGWVSVTVAAAPLSVIELPPPPLRTISVVVAPLVDGRSSAKNE